MEKVSAWKRCQEPFLTRIERGESLTDWARVRAMSDAEVESAAAQDPEWQDVDPDWVAKAKPVHPVRSAASRLPSTRT